MAATKTLAELLLVSAKLSLDEFLRSFDAHYLVASGVLGGSLREGRERTETGVLELGDRVSHMPSNPNPQAGIAYPLKKAKHTQGPDAGRITVGRAGEADVCIADPSVSHLHAFFEREGEVMYLVDDESRNGTFVNLARLAPHERKSVHDEDVVTFGRVSYQVFSPGALYIALQAFREGAI